MTADYGAFRDLQRRPMLSIDWQYLTPANTWPPPPAALPEAGGERAWHRAMRNSATLHAKLAAEHGPAVAQYCLPMATRLRFTMRMNAREAMHVLELRTQPAGHATYREICQQMHQLIRNTAGHQHIAHATEFVDHRSAPLGRLDAEKRTEARRDARKNNEERPQ